MWNKVYQWFAGLIEDTTTRLSLGSSGMVIWLGSLDWNMVFMVLGFLMGVATFLVNWYYKHKSLAVFKEASAKAAERGYILREPKE